MNLDGIPLEPSIPRSPEPRFPLSEEEASRVYRAWDPRNGRYYFVADVVLDDGRLLRDLTFDGDTSIAVSFEGRPISVQAELFRRKIVAWIVTADCALGSLRPGATEVEREEFFRSYRGTAESELDHPH